MRDRIKFGESMPLIYVYVSSINFTLISVTTSFQMAAEKVHNCKFGNNYILEISRMK